MLREDAINKVKLLLALTKSPNTNEAANAQTLADKLIAKYELQEPEYKSDDKPSYDTSDNLLFEEVILTEWRGIVAIACANKYDCSIIREDATATTTIDTTTTYRYYVYGDDTDVIQTRLLFQFVASRIDDLMLTYCRGKSNLYEQSFGEGAANGVKDNIAYETFAVEGMVKTEAVEEVQPRESLVKTSDAIAKPEPPIKETKTINTREKPIDIVAYIRGEKLGGNIHIGDYIDDDHLLDDLTMETSLWDRLKGVFARSIDEDDWLDEDYDDL